MAAQSSVWWTKHDVDWFEGRAHCYAARLVWWVDQKHYLSQREAERRRRGRTNVASPGVQGESWFGYQSYRNEASRSGVLAGEKGPKKILSKMKTCSAVFTDFGNLDLVIPKSLSCNVRNPYDVVYLSLGQLSCCRVGTDRADRAG